MRWPLNHKERRVILGFDMLLLPSHRHLGSSIGDSLLLALAYRELVSEPPRASMSRQRQRQRQRQGQRQRQRQRQRHRRVRETSAPSRHARVPAEEMRRRESA